MFLSILLNNLDFFTYSAMHRIMSLFFPFGSINYLNIHRNRVDFSKFLRVAPIKKN